MGWLSDALKFEHWRGKELLGEFKSHPQRLLMGAGDPLGTSIYNTVWGSKFEPLGNQLGAPTEDQYARAEAAGINTGAGRGANDIAQVIAAYYGGGALGNAAGGAGGAAGAGGAGGANSFWQQAGRSAVQAGMNSGKQPAGGSAPDSFWQNIANKSGSNSVWGKMAGRVLRDRQGNAPMGASPVIDESGAAGTTATGPSPVISNSDQQRKRELIAQILRRRGF